MKMVWMNRSSVGKNHNSSNCYSRVSPLKKKNTKFLKNTHFAPATEKKTWLNRLKISYKEFIFVK